MLKRSRVFCSGCNFTSPCCHHTANFTWELGPVCEAGVTEPRYCPAPKLGGMVGEGVGCDLTLSCEAGQTITGVEFADWGLPYADASGDAAGARATGAAGGGAGAGDPLHPNAACSFKANHTVDARGQVCTTQNTTMALVRKKCVGKQSCTFTHADTKMFGDPCGGASHARKSPPFHIV